VLWGAVPPPAILRYSVIARKDGDRVRLWARTRSDYSKAFTRIRDAVAALPVDSALLGLA
jgi:ATP-dependent DNA ligase